MSIEQIQQKMEKLKLNHTLPFVSELFDEAAKQNSSAMDFFEKLLSLEVEAREESRIAASLKVSGLPKGMHLDNFDFLFQPSADKSKIEHLATCEFIRRHENILFFGPPYVVDFSVNKFGCVEVSGDFRPFILSPCSISHLLRSSSRMIQGAPTHTWVAGKRPLRISL